MTVRLQQQGHNECFPTVVGMLAGVPKDEIIQWALLGTPYNFWAEVGKADRRALQQVICDAFLPWLDGCEVNRVRYGFFEPVPLPAVFRARGCLTIYGATWAHIVAFEQGVIYDPSESTAIPIQNFLARAAACGAVVANLMVEPA